jgi:exodeoxyribonuclease VII small subunit
MNKRRKMAKKKFEEALQELETIVQRLEDGNLSLDESLALFEEGIKLSRLCSQRLDEAEKKVEILLKNENGSLSRQPFEPEEDSADT